MYGRISVLMPCSSSGPAPRRRGRTTSELPAIRLMGQKLVPTVSRTRFELVLPTTAVSNTIGYWDF